MKKYENDSPKTLDVKRVQAVVKKYSGQDYGKVLSHIMRSYQEGKEYPIFSTMLNQPRRSIPGREVNEVD